jgi:hypothetical protein
VAPVASTMVLLGIKHTNLERADEKLQWPFVWRPSLSFELGKRRTMASSKRPLSKRERKIDKANQNATARTFSV